MKTATITEVKNGLSAFLDRVRAGETVLILDRGIPVARLEPASTLGREEGRIARLERAGILTPARTTPPVELISEPGPSLPEGVSAVEFVIEERRSGR
jgi:prevent-host-death family protein